MKVNPTNTYNKYLQKVNPQNEVNKKSEETKEVKKVDDEVKVTSVPKDEEPKATGNNVDIKV